MIINRNILCSLGLLMPVMAFGWGQKGHDTVAYIAECHLSPEAKALAEELLDGKSIVYYANWMDNASHTPEYSYSKTWHYKNVDADQTYESAKKNKDGDIVSALEQQIEKLGNKNLTKDERALALKMVVHFLGDIHQPLHLGHQKDLGGNRWDVEYFGSPKNLHSVWDTSMVESAHKWSYTEWQKQIDRISPEAFDEIVAVTSPNQMAIETYELCKDVYDGTPMGTNVEFNYIAKWTPVIENQLLKGGLRLAQILNTTLGNQ